MSAVELGKFGCEGCGRLFAWSAARAGKKGKCSCGAVLVVPMTEPGREAGGGAAKKEEEEEGLPFENLYEVAEPPPKAAPKAVVSVAAPGGAVGVGGAGKAQKKVGPAPVAYQRAAVKPDDDKITSLPRDLYWPVGLLVAGFLGFVIWAIVIFGEGMVGVGAVAVYVGGSTVVKTVVLIGLAFVFAPMAGVSFGTVGPAVLKFAAIIVFTDVAILWFDEIWRMMTSTPQLKRGMGLGIWLTLIITMLMVSGLCMYLFDMDWEETRMFAMPFSVAKAIIGLVINFALMRVMSDF